MELEWLNLFPAWLLMFVRVLAFFSALPIFSFQTLPTTFRIGIAGYLSFIMFFIVEPDPIPVDGLYFLLIGKEIMLGLFLGMAANIIFSAVQTAGAFIDYKMGFLVANVIDPQTGAQTPLSGGLLNAFAILFLLAVDGHHVMLDGIYYSYEYVPLTQLYLPFGEEGIARFIVETFSQTFLIAFQISFPIVGSLFLVDIALGMMSRAVPQMNVFVVGLPLKIFLGLPILLLMLPAFFTVVSDMVDFIGITIRTLLEMFGGVDE
ncbi:flagellar biosynthetic protein FliR [Salsuginibacillus kocurii]|uniref:flagellar biosynthetic protein FliR n=1 Tax=Salsuginibacillus kocurii TaxID=427078 RepID=UPI00036C21A3|nr:flagellar biosynthetic protein FliR [Salsuginibacillus kocurii]